MKLTRDGCVLKLVYFSAMTVLSTDSVYKTHIEHWPFLATAAFAVLAVLGLTVCIRMIWRQEYDD